MKNKFSTPISERIKVLESQISRAELYVSYSAITNGEASYYQNVLNEAKKELRDLKLEIILKK